MTFWSQKMLSGKRTGCSLLNLRDEISRCLLTLGQTLCANRVHPATTGDNSTRRPRRPSRVRIVCVPDARTWDARGDTATGVVRENHAAALHEVLRAVTGGYQAPVWSSGNALFRCHVLLHPLSPLFRQPKRIFITWYGASAALLKDAGAGEQVERAL